MSKPFIIVSTADWDNPFWTNKQHIADRLAGRGHQVLYLNSLGLRKPSSNGKDIKRIIKRLSQFFSGLQQKKTNLWVWSPVVIPYQRFSFVRKLNFFIVRQCVLHFARKLGMEDYVLWTYNPLTQPLLNMREQLSVYHCVDEISAQPGMPEQIIKEQEARLVADVDVVFATAPNLYETRKAINESTYYSPNVAEFNHFNKALSPDTDIPAELLQMKGPKVGFIGAISGYKLDLALIEKVASRNPHVHFVFIGQVGEGDPWTDADRLGQTPNIHLIGPKPYSELPGYLKGFDACLLPNVINEYTTNMFPMKFFEYLSAGKPVVMTPLPAVRDYYSYCYVAADADAFDKQLGLALNEGLLGNYEQLIMDRVAEAKKHDWESRIDTMLAVVEAHIKGAGAPEALRAANLPGAAALGTPASPRSSKTSKAARSVGSKA
ncbi:glycosyltransferase [Paenibacillus sp. FSL H8-0537]|uniref:glycosyltransferase n=1 Tax=Paenibacillus sp. FSL H8-0537 TaxID=2921399 RepID=UPI003100E44D